MQITYKTKKEVTINPRTLEEAIIYIDLNDVLFQIEEEQYKANSVYYTLSEDGTRNIIETVNTTIPFAQADQIAEMGGLMRNTLTEINVNAYRTTIIYSLNAGRYYGLTSEDWEPYTKPAPEVPEIPQDIVDEEPAE